MCFIFDFKFIAIKIKFNHYWSCFTLLEMTDPMCAIDFNFVYWVVYVQLLITELMYFAYTVFRFS